MRRQLVIIAIAVAAIAAPAFAGDDPAQPPGANQGPMTVERVSNGWLIAPDVQVGRVGKSTTTMVGAYGGWMFQNTILVGGAGYFQVDRSEPRRIDYGGGIVEWLSRTDRRIGFGARALVGAGSATIDNGPAVFPTDFGGGIASEPSFGHHIPIDFPVPDDIRIRHVVFRQNFAIFEPQGDVLINIAPRLRIRAAGGYRFIGAGHGWGDQLHGALVSVGLEIGGSSSRRVGP